MKHLRVALDANLLLLLIVGKAGEPIVLRHKRLQKYNLASFRKLVEILTRTSVVIVTPHVLTEVSNLMLFGMLEPDKARIQDSFAEIAMQLDEQWIKCGKILNAAEFRWLDLADCAWLSLLDIETILLTDDYKLSAAASARNFQAFSLEQIDF
jgi:hypothetical protein